MLYGLIALFTMVYLLRALLMTGYERLNVKSEKGKEFPFISRLLSIIILVKPLLQPKLRATSIDHKRHLVFQQKESVYYYLLWAVLFIILFLAAKIYLGAF